MSLFDCCRELAIPFSQKCNRKCSPRFSGYGASRCNDPRSGELSCPPVVPQSVLHLDVHVEGEKRELSAAFVTQTILPSKIPAEPIGGTAAHARQQNRRHGNSYRRFLHRERCVTAGPADRHNRWIVRVQDSRRFRIRRSQEGWGHRTHYCRGLQDALASRGQR